MSKDTLSILKETVKSYPNFPTEGIIFRDFLPILLKPPLFDDMLCLFQEYLNVNVPDIQAIAGLESRGFLIGAPLSLKMNLPFIPLRKAGKLPGNVIKVPFSLEYGKDSLEIQEGMVKQDQKVVIIDDLLATGGSMQAAIRLIKDAGGVILHCLFVIELNELKGRQKFTEPVYSLLHF